MIRFCSNQYELYSKLDCVDLQGDYEAAKTLALATKDPAAAFHLGRHFDHQDNVREAIRFYTQAQRFGNALQLAKRHGMDGELMALALQVRGVFFLQQFSAAARQGKPAPLIPLIPLIPFTRRGRRRRGSSLRRHCISRERICWTALRFSSTRRAAWTTH